MLGSVNRTGRLGSSSSYFEHGDGKCTYRTRGEVSRWSRWPPYCSSPARGAWVDKKTSYQVSRSWGLLPLSHKIREHMPSVYPGSKHRSIKADERSSSSRFPLLLGVGFRAFVRARGTATPSFPQVPTHTHTLTIYTFRLVFFFPILHVRMAQFLISSVPPRCSHAEFGDFWRENTARRNLFWTFWQKSCITSSPTPLTYGKCCAKKCSVSLELSVDRHMHWINAHVHTHTYVFWAPHPAPSQFARLGCRLSQPTY